MRHIRDRSKTCAHHHVAVGEVKASPLARGSRISTHGEAIIAPQSVPRSARVRCPGWRSGRRAAPGPRVARRGDRVHRAAARHASTPSVGDVQAKPACAQRSSTGSAGRSRSSRDRQRVSLARRHALRARMDAVAFVPGARELPIGGPTSAASVFASIARSHTRRGRARASRDQPGFSYVRRTRWASRRDSARRRASVAAASRSRSPPPPTGFRPRAALGDPASGAAARGPDLQVLRARTPLDDGGPTTPRAP